MTIFVDASAIIAMMTNEPEAAALVETLLKSDGRATSAIALWESARGVARKRKIPTIVARQAVTEFADDFDIGIVTIGTLEGIEAIGAHDRYGKGNHPARLNMGDCFAYACARTNAAELLYKGDDFALTDLA